MIGFSRGDTLVEVLLAVTVFSMVAVGTIAVMNEGTNAAQRSLEITQVRQQIDAQAESLRAAHQAYLASDTSTVWPEIAAKPDASTDLGRCPRTQTEINGAFVMNPNNAEVLDNWFASISSVDAPPYAQVTDNNGLKAYGIWIEKQTVGGANGDPGRYDFSVRACWYGAGMGETPMELQTLVRLYDPSN